MEPGGCFPVYNIEFQLQIAGTKITGNSYHFSDTSNYVKEIFEGVYDTVQNLCCLMNKKFLYFIFLRIAFPVSNNIRSLIILTENKNN